MIGEESKRMDQNTVRVAAASLGAVEDDRIPGLWHMPGHPELTTGQLIDLFGRMAQNVPIEEVFRRQSGFTS